MAWRRRHLRRGRFALALTFIERYQTPESAAHLGAKRMAAFCALCAHSGRRSPESLLARLQHAACTVCGAWEMNAKGELAKSLARSLACLVEQIRRLTSRIEPSMMARSP